MEGYIKTAIMLLSGVVLGLGIALLMEVYAF